MIIVDEKAQLDIIYDKLKSSDSFLLLIPTNPFDNSPFNGISLVFIYLFQYEETYCLVHDHPDFDFVVNLQTFFNNIETNRHIYVYNKKLFLSCLDDNKDSLKSNFIDVNFVNYIINNTSISNVDLENVTNVYNKFLTSYKNKNIHSLIPINSHYEYYELLLNNIKKLYTDNKYFLYNSTDLLIKLDEYYTNNYFEFEKNGIYVNHSKLKKFNENIFIKNNIIYNNYIFFTKTGRPTNNYCKFNFLALNKKSGVRKIFESRFEENGLLYQFDYNSFHLKLISVLIDDVQKENNLHLFLGKKLEPNLDLSVKSNYDAIKQIIFRQIYGGVSTEYEHIPFFKKMKIFIDTLWEEYNRENKVYSKIFKRPIYKKWFNADPTFNKLTLFNYYIQSFESEFCVFIIKDINTYLRNNDLKSKLILYTYDSFLFDIINDEKSNLKDIKKIIEFNDYFITDISFGKNYDELHKIQL